MYRFSGSNIYVTDIRPGFVDTAMVRGQGGLFWVASPEGAAEQIFQAIKKKREVAYITKRWNIIAWLIRLMRAWLWSWGYKRR